MAATFEPILIDIAEFFANPIRTGIQRTVRQLIAHWPAQVPMRCVRYDAGLDDLVEISDAALSFILDREGDDRWSAEELGREATLIDATRARPVRRRPGSEILIPELFFCTKRIEYFQRCVQSGDLSPHLLIYDYVPWLRPDLYQLGARTALTVMPYLMLTLAVRQRCFISEAVRASFISRIARIPHRDPGPVFRPGAEGLKIERQIFDESRRDIVCLGTLEGKKRQDITFDAYRSLRLSGDDGVLRIIGRIARPTAPWLEKVVTYRGTDIEIIEAPPDAVVHDHLRRARALAFTSTGEGYGLPALEALGSGIPVIVHAALPSLETVGSAGQIRLDDISVEAVADAFRQMRDDTFARRLWAEVSTLTLPSWATFASGIAEWVSRDRVGARIIGRQDPARSIAEIGAA